MFTEAERAQLRTRLLDRARADRCISGAAITGSAAHGAADRWSDIDLFFGVAPESALDDVVGAWSQFLYQELGALHHFDLHAGPAHYRAFLLPQCLEVDLAFTPAADFGARGPHFQIVFGEPIAQPPAPPTDRGHLIGLAWHHVLHARICLERHKLWQAEYWISAVRDHTLTLACLRYGQPASFAKGVDALPVAVTRRLEEALVRTLTPPDLWRALGVTAAALLDEIGAVDIDLAHRLEGTLRELAGMPAGSSG
jgi:predicted nucleotidyltransferase